MALLTADDVRNVPTTVGFTEQAAVSSTPVSVLRIVNTALIGVALVLFIALVAVACYLTAAGSPVWFWFLGDAPMGEGLTGIDLSAVLGGGN